MAEQVVVGEQVAGRAMSVRKELLRMSADINHTAFDAAELLFEAQENNYPVAWGFSSVLDYGVRELGLKKRKVQYLTRIVKVCRAVGLKRAQYDPAGTSKLREICSLDPDGSYFNKETRLNESLDEHIVRLILDHDKMNVVQVKSEVAKLKGQVGKDRRVIRSYSTDAATWENVISNALELARRMLGSKGRDDEGNAKEYSEGECYEVICAAFLADPNNVEDPAGFEAVKEKPIVPPSIPMEEI